MVDTISSVLATSEKATGDAGGQCSIDFMLRGTKDHIVWRSNID